MKINQHKKIMEYSGNLFYTKDNEWISFDGEYDIVYVDISTLNSKVNKNEVLVLPR